MPAPRLNDLPARVYSNQIRGCVTSTDGRWRLAAPEHDWLHLCRCGIERPASAPQLPAQNHLALPSARVIGKLIALRPTVRRESKRTSGFAYQRLENSMLLFRWGSGSRVRHIRGNNDAADLLADRRIC
jgi:hypothetical protein